MLTEKNRKADHPSKRKLPKVLVFSNAHFPNFRYSNGSPMIPRQDDQTRFPNEIFYTCSSTGYQWDVSNGNMRLDDFRSGLWGFVEWAPGLFWWERATCFTFLFTTWRMRQVRGHQSNHCQFFFRARSLVKLVFLGFLLSDMNETAVAYWTRRKGHSTGDSSLDS